MRLKTKCAPPPEAIAREAFELELAGTNSKPIGFDKVMELAARWRSVLAMAAVAASLNNATEPLRDLGDPELTDLLDELEARKKELSSGGESEDNDEGARTSKMVRLKSRIRERRIESKTEILFHQTDYDVGQKICREQRMLRGTNPNSLAGPGIYFAVSGNGGTHWC